MRIRAVGRDWNLDLQGGIRSGRLRIDRFIYLFTLNLVKSKENLNDRFIYSAFGSREKREVKGKKKRRDAKEDTLSLLP